MATKSDRILESAIGQIQSLSDSSQGHDQGVVKPLRVRPQPKDTVVIKTGTIVTGRASPASKDIRSSRRSTPSVDVCSTALMTYSTMDSAVAQVP